MQLFKGGLKSERAGEIFHCRQTFYYALRLLNSDFCYHLTRPFNLNQANLLSSKAIFLKIVISTYKLCKIFYRALREMPPVQFSPVQPAGSSCYALRLLNSDFCESSQGNNLLHVGRKEPHVSKISWHHALGSTLFSKSENIKGSCYVHLYYLSIGSN